MNTTTLSDTMSKSRSIKLITNLKGILEGIKIDGIINEEECNELNLWVKESKDLVDRNPFNEIIININSILENNNVNEKIQDIIWLCNKHTQYNFFFDAIKADLQLLEGLCHGILADGVINDNEIIKLNKWIEEREHLNSYYPYDEIRSLLKGILSDGVIDADETKLLKAYLFNYVNIKNKDVSDQIKLDIGDLNVGSFCAANPKISIPKSNILLTGTFKTGRIEDINNRIENAGGIIIGSEVTKELNYLVVGDAGSQAWAFSCYGRKVEKAVELRKSGVKILVVHEADFINSLKDLES